MTKAQDILAQNATEAQKRRWAEGNAVRHEHDSTKGSADFYFADGSQIQLRAIVGLTAT
jgi:hypothetical protein